MRLMAISWWFIVSGCSAATDPLPELAQGLSGAYAEGERAFDRRLKQRFPPGTSERELTDALERQGFRRLPPVDGVEDATFFRDRFPFRTIWSVRWRTDRGRVIAIWGVYGVQAP